MFLRELFERSRCENWIRARTTFLSCRPAVFVLPAAHPASAASFRSLALRAVLSSLGRCFPSCGSACTAAISAPRRQLRDAKLGPTGTPAQPPGMVVVVVAATTVVEVLVGTATSQLSAV